MPKAKKPTQSELAAVREKYIRVTEALSIIKNEGYEDFRIAVGKRRAYFVLEEKADFGNQVHDIGEAYNISRIEKKPFDIVACGRSGEYLISALNASAKYVEWADRHIEEVLFAEHRVYDDDYFFSGRLDLILRMKGDQFFSIADIKTTEVISPTVRLQLAAYKEAAEKNHGIKIKRRFAIRVTEEDLKIKEFTDPASLDFRLFLYALELKRNLG